MTADTTIFGDWSQVVLAELGSGVDIVAYPYSLALTGMIRVHAARLVDVGYATGPHSAKSPHKRGLNRLPAKHRSDRETRPAFFVG